ncbi:hypothetical protein VTH82DRAFT_8053 [Thermothelomyces myriococcoides]
MQSANPEHFFETDAAQEKRQRQAAKASNKYGKPIALKSKILAAVPDPRSPGSAILVAESAGAVRLINLNDPENLKTAYRGPAAPVCCVAVGGPGSGTLFAGSWDKNIWSWDLNSKAPGRKYVGHTDFVKALTCATVGGKDLLISGGADKKIMVWDIATGARLHTLQDSEVNIEEISLISASSDPHIRRWKIRLDGWEQVAEPSPDAPGTDRRTILEHETTVYKLVLDQDSDDADLWTSSGDGTAKCLSRVKNFACEDTFRHGDHVRAVAVTDQWVVTAGRDEDVKFWDRSSGNLYCSLVGHYDEVTDLVVLKDTSGSTQRICSVSIDGTVRTWPVDKAAVDAAVKEQEKPTEEGKNKVAGEGLLSPEEEAELAALMDDD